MYTATSVPEKNRSGIMVWIDKGKEFRNNYPRFLQYLQALHQMSVTCGLDCANVESPS